MEKLTTVLAVCVCVLSAQAVTIHRSFSGGYPAGSARTTGAQMGGFGVSAQGGAHRDTQGRPQGRLQATTRGNGSKTEYRDAQGRLICTSTTDAAGHTTYRDAQGRILDAKSIRRVRSADRP